MMASGGDLGASIGPQLIGIITDTTGNSARAVSFAQSLGLSTEQLGMKLGMIVGMLFPLVAIFVYLFILKTKNRTALK
jgi:cyanate permease